jgi:TRAP-type C4-dicarboxylate transport system permease small subunit
VISRTLDQLARGIMLGGLALMLLLSASGIVSRWLGLSFMWLDPLVRHLVIVTAFAGGVLAIGKKNHIKIDLLSHPMEKMPKKARWVVQLILSFVTAIITGALTWSAWLFFQSEQEYGAIGLLGLHSSIWVAIFAFGWGMMTLRWVSALFDTEGKH